MSGGPSLCVLQLGLAAAGPLVDGLRLADGPAAVKVPPSRATAWEGSMISLISLLRIVMLPSVNQWETVFGLLRTRV